MAKVTLKRNWFGPDGVLYEVRHNPVLVPDLYVDKLPKDAEVEGKEEKPSKPTAADKKAAEDKAAADKKAAEDKAAEDKKIADQKALDDKAAADKAAADKAEADKQANLKL